MGVGLVRSLQPWDILLIYCNSQFKKYITPLLRLVRGALSKSLLMSTSEYLWLIHVEVWQKTTKFCKAIILQFKNKIKLCYTKALEWSSLVPGPKTKSSSSKIKNPTPFTVGYHHFGKAIEKVSSWPNTSQQWLRDTYVFKIPLLVAKNTQPPTK